jgi:signal transduction histidine kinase/CheY-like chemotaxis protein
MSSATPAESRRQIAWDRFGRLRGYRAGFAIFSLTVILDYILAKTGAPGVAIFFVTMLGLLGTAWCGYVTGIVSTALFALAVPYLVKENFSYRQTDPYGLTTLLLISLVVSRVSNNRARAEDRLRQTNDILDERVRRRTAELEQANRELSNHLAEIENLYSQLSLGVCFLDTELRYVRLNDRIAEFDGAPVSEHIGCRMADMLPPEVARILEPLFQRVADTAEPLIDYEIRAATYVQEAGERDWLISCTPVKSGSGAVIGVQVIVQDISGRKRFEEELRHTAKLESLGLLAGGIAHDFNNLLTGIMGNASLAQETFPSNHEAAALLDDVIHASEKASDLTRQLLAYAGKGKFVIQPVAVSALVEEIYPLIDSAIKSAASVQLDLDAGSLRVSADAAQLQQLIMNLVINAGEAIPEGQSGIITVRTRRQTIDNSFIRSNRLLAAEQLAPGDYLCFEVEDTGAGMDAATLDRIFDPFFTTKFTGRGLGLSAVLGIVRSHRGAMAVSSSPGGGTTFRVYLPLTEEEVPVKAGAAAPRACDTGQAVLVVDDEDVVRRTANATLARYGYRVLLASSGPEAISMYRRHEPDITLVLLDLTMPGMDGEQTLGELRRIRPEVRVVLSSGYDESDIARRFAGQRLAGFIQKPYTAAALAQKIAAASLQPETS